MLRRALALSLASLFLISLVRSPLAVAEPAPTEIIQMVESTSSAQNYPNGWTHRPVAEVFTSLSCPPCMSNSEPQAVALGEMLVEQEGQPFTVITFHQTNGGAHDDPTASEDANQRYDHYSPVGTPDGEFDGGYVQSQDLYASLEESGQRDVKPTTLLVYQVYQGEGRFSITANLTYLGESYSPDPSDPVGSLNDLADGDVLDYELHLFVIENDVHAYSSEVGGMVHTPFVYRGSAGEPATGTIESGESAVVKVDWAIPTEIEHPDGHATPGVHPMDPMVVPGNIEVVAVIYDLDDEAQSSSPNPKQGIPRAINSATPASTAYDEENTPPEIMNVDETIIDGNANIQAFFDDEDGVSMAHVFYNYESENYTGEWFTDSLEIQGSEICDEEGVCYAYGDAVGMGTIPALPDKPIYYQLVFSDGKENYNTNEITAFAGGEILVPAPAGFNLVLFGAIAVIFLALAGFAIWARQPYTGTYFD